MAIEAISTRGAVVLVAAPTTNSTGGDAAIVNHYVFGVGDGMVSSIELFPIDRLGAARARFAELGGAQGRAAELENMCTRVLSRQEGYRRAGGWDELARLLAADVRGQDRRRVIGSGALSGIAAHVEDARSASGMGRYTLHDVPVALRGERLALTRRAARDVSGESAVEMLAVTLLDPEGRVTRWATFDRDDVDAAYAQLDDWYIENEGVPNGNVWRLVCAWRDAFNARDWEALRRVLHPDTAVIDHNLRGYEAHGPAEVRALSEAIATAEPEHVMRFQRVDEVGPQGAIIRVSASPTHADGVEFNTLFLNVLGIREGRVWSCDIYPPEQLTEARARLAELDAGRDAHSAPWNRASEVTRRAVET